MSIGEQAVVSARGVGASAADAVRAAVQSCIDALSPHVAILDPGGTILAVTQGWRRFADANRLISSGPAVGELYLSACDAAAAGGDSVAADVAAGIRAVARGERAHFTPVYACHGTQARRWFRHEVTRLDYACEACVITAHED